MKKRTKALAITPETKRRVYERDGERCVLCGARGYPNAHFIARSQGGLGIEENIVTLCVNCHNAYDNSAFRRVIREELREYLKEKYPDWEEQKLYYRKDGI